ncbi:MAG: hypothetical protein KDK24_20915 [Pseudooceanicola sp.]|nr:hypothetical protein [Pseudooceanicola sp.]
MKPKARFIQSVIDTARKTEVELPFDRGPRRAAFIARRNAEETRKPAKAS